MDHIFEMTNNTINLILNDVTTNILNDEKNYKLDARVQIAGNFNEWGLRSHDIIKMKNNKLPLLFFENY
jgi:hypothetical protein